KLFLIVPFVERARLVESLVTLEPDELGVEDFRQHLGDFGLARAGGTLDQERFFERERQKDRRLDALVGDVAGALEAVGDLFARQHHLKFPSTPRPLRLGAPAARRSEAPTSCLRPISLDSASAPPRGACGAALGSAHFVSSPNFPRLRVRSASGRLRRGARKRPLRVFAQFPSTPRPLRLGAPAARRSEAPTSCLRPISLDSASAPPRGACGAAL